MDAFTGGAAPAPAGSLDMAVDQSTGYYLTSVQASCDGRLFQVDGEDGGPGLYI